MIFCSRRGKHNIMILVYNGKQDFMIFKGQGISDESCYKGLMTQYY